MKKKLLSWLLVISMVTSMVPTVVFAAEGTNGSFEQSAAGALSLVEQAEAALVKQPVFRSAPAYAPANAALLSEGSAIPASTIGGEDNPFQIGNATVLEEFANLVGTGATYGANGEYSYADASYVLCADIDMSGKSWTAVNGFNGTFYGAVG